MDYMWKPFSLHLEVMTSRRDLEVAKLAADAIIHIFPRVGGGNKEAPRRLRGGSGEAPRRLRGGSEEALVHQAAPPYEVYFVLETKF